MTRLPVLRPQAVIAVLKRSGFVVTRVRGSHYQMLDPESGRRVTVPHHNRDLTRATLASILYQAGLTVDAFIERL